MRDKVIREAEYVTLAGGPRTGQVSVPSSKSQLHRLLICAALGERPVEICYKGLSEDIRATANCLNALGAKISAKEVLLGLGIGCVNLGSSSFTVSALQHLPNSIVYPTITVSIILLTTLVGVLFFGDRLEKKQKIAMGIAIAAVIILNL